MGASDVCSAVELDVEPAMPSAFKEASSAMLSPSCPHHSCGSLPNALGTEKWQTLNAMNLSPGKRVKIKTLENRFF